LRIGEMLGLQWQDIDLERNEIHVRRVQENDGKTFDATKTEAGTCTIRMGPTLREMFLNRRERCPCLDAEVFRMSLPGARQVPGPGRNRGRAAAGRCSIPTIGCRSGSRSLSGCSSRR
jgi:integrase